MIGIRRRIRKDAAAPDDGMLSRSMRALAVEENAICRGRLVPKAGETRALERILSRANRLRAVVAGSADAIETLVRDGAVMLSCAEQARMETARDLPKCRGGIRIYRIAKRIVGNGGAAITRDRLMLAIASYDDVQALEMAEIWAFPEALRIALCEEFRIQAENALEIGEEHRLAERWAAGASVNLNARGNAFFEHAARLTAENENVRRMRRLERALFRRGLNSEAIVREAHAESALIRLRLENLLAGKRLIDAIDWQESFRLLSNVEGELNSDPAGTYPNMEPASRAAVRREVAHLARGWRLNEITVARYAIHAAMRASERDSELDSLERNVCYWLYDDAGRSALAREIRMPEPRRRIPDPTGRRCAWGLSALAAVLFMAFALNVKRWTLIPLGIPILWQASSALIGRVFPKLLKPRMLLKMEYALVPDDARTLVTMPALLSSVERAKSVCDQIETLGCMEKSVNIRYLILGDFADADAEHCPNDDEIANAARECVRRMNERAGEEKYYYLHRGRSYLASDARWMGRDRKRGALAALNRLILNANGAEEAFSVESAACESIRGRFRYVLTIDEGTRFMPEAARRLIGAIAHPLNQAREIGGAQRGYAIVFPEMLISARARVNRFVKLFAGDGGTSAYPCAVSNLYFDACGMGLFGGKGVYDVRAFSQAMEGALPEGKILSHDMIEGALAGAALASDISFFEGFPATIASLLRRENRWTRGDWQLIGLLFSKKRFPQTGKRLSAIHRIWILSNLLRSLYAPALVSLLTSAIWFGDAGVCALGVICAYLPALLYPNREAWKRATAELAILPMRVACAGDAILRTLWRLIVSKRHLMEWVASADAESGGNRYRPACGVAVILLAPGLLVPPMIPAALALGGLFAVAPGWMRDMEMEELGKRPVPNAHNAAEMRALAREIWAFFDRYVAEQTHFLPPDNVQIDPPTGAAKRTSGTNIGLYLLACVCARELGFIDAEEMHARIAATTGAMEQMEKWCGNLYNWYDTQTLKPLSPKYVSSVDGGNLIASILLCVQAVSDSALSKRLNALAENMDLTALYDAPRGLFRIGFDAEGRQPSLSHYDLIASESRILSLIAVMRGDAPESHWAKLSRAGIASGKRFACLSWSGTMFEYLMPEIFFRAPENSMLGESVRAAIGIQRAQGERRDRPWGVSESGYAAFDAMLNYQYRAFGLRALSLGMPGTDNVVAPYASLLAAPIAPNEVAENMREMDALGWHGEYGFFESADYVRAGADGAPRLVKSYMAHHQGMALCAIANALTGGVLERTFEKDPRVRAIEPLLEEKIPKMKRTKRLRARVEPDYVPAARGESRVPGLNGRQTDAHPIAGGGALAIVSSDGTIRYRRGDLLGTRFAMEFSGRPDGMRLRMAANGESVILHPVLFEPGAATLESRIGAVSCTVRACISPEDGALFLIAEVRNDSERSVRVKILNEAAIALDGVQDERAHPAFRQMFVESDRPRRWALRFRRRMRMESDALPELMHLINAPGSVACETALDALLNRAGEMQPLSGNVGAVLNPCSALQAEIELQSNERAKLHFTFGFSEDGEAWLERNYPESAAERALRLSGMQARAMHEFLAIDTRRRNLLDCAAALMLNPRRLERESEPCGNAPRSALWAAGISGELPIWLLRVKSHEELPRVREMIAAHAYYRMLGVKLDLAIVYGQSADYEQPVRDALADAIHLSHLGALENAQGGVRLFSDADSQSVAALSRAAVFEPDLTRDLDSQMKTLIESENAPARRPKRMNAGESRLPALFGNGIGAFLSDGRYAIRVSENNFPPAPWCNLLCNDGFGVLTTERGGGFLWHGSSRTGRITPFTNDPLHDGWGWMLYLYDEETREFAPLLPGKEPFTEFECLQAPYECVYRFESERLSGEIAMLVLKNAPQMRIHATVRSPIQRRVRLIGFVDWLMGAEIEDARALRTWTRGGACFASGAMPGVGCFACADARANAGGGRNAFLGCGGILNPDGIGESAPRTGGWRIEIPILMQKDAPVRTDWMIGWAESADRARTAARAFMANPDYESARDDVFVEWQMRMSGLFVQTPEEKLNRMMNGWLTHQTLSSRVRARTGFYQPGGAYGFRDQFQDMLALLPLEPERVRAHLLRAAARQFPEGDVLHWWHEPYSGVRTHISDDKLFLPYVAAKYMRFTGDSAVLGEMVRYLESVPIESGKEDIYCEMRPGNAIGNLHDHCMRAFRSVQTGAHGLALMGGGDWNDGMNRVGAKGKGESVWLSEFMVVCAEEYAAVSPEQSDAAWLRETANAFRSAIEKSAWDGEWYLRAFYDDGTPLGSRQNAECRIDGISQAWAVLAGLDSARCRSAMNAAWNQLVDEKHGVIRLLAPPFTSEGRDPGYIRGYPEGVRENGAQYTHAACWFLLALIRMGDEARAHRALRMLIPETHADTREKLMRYRVEPYVVPADVYAGIHAGRGGWTWYTGSASWLYICVLELLGFERCGAKVRLNAMLGDWEEAAVIVRFGSAKYRLIARKGAERITLDGAPAGGDFIEMIDDGRDHEALFPPRSESIRENLRKLSAEA